MKKKSQTKSEPVVPDVLRSEYDLDYSKVKPNRFAADIPKHSVAVLLDPDVADFFKNAQSVNDVLRALMTAMPAR